ncbi:hypothetical protein [Acanthopleuribacter pedis]|uniref:Uncharacterized protein n=1 Tax=Acanthopleuribacter pedis TaxID=442870 RepID=A0A8J7U277_9BACT|nr:hypothetical protein [Acanthopleuribacter pedis]MBO1318993.1 hypothetical protein [Acanthopleuribacter pedis]
MSPTPRYDAILQDGTYLIDVPVSELSGVVVHHRLKLGPFERLPWLGKIRRNMWAKKRGGRVDHTIKYKRL